MGSQHLAEYAVYLPLRYNNRKKIPQTKFRVTLIEVAIKFGYESHSYIHRLSGRERGGHGEPFCRVYVHVWDSPSHDRWFSRYRKILEARFKQRQIYVTKMGRSGLTTL